MRCTWSTQVVRRPRVVAPVRRCGLNERKAAARFFLFLPSDPLLLLHAITTQDNLQSSTAIIMARILPLSSDQTCTSTGSTDTEGTSVDTGQQVSARAQRRTLR